MSYVNKRPAHLTSSAATLTLDPEIQPLGHIIEIHIGMLNKHAFKSMEKRYVDGTPTSEVTPVTIRYIRAA